MTGAAELRDARSVGPHIRSLLPILTALEARIVERLMHDRRLTEQATLREVSSDVGVSDAMVVKLAKKLGFAGFRELRGAIASYNQLPTAELHEAIADTDGDEVILRKVFRTSIQALEETVAILDPAVFSRAADCLAAARQRDFYGVGGSAQIARDVAHKFLRIGVRASMFDDSHMMLMSASMLRPGDVAVGFSHSGETAAVIEPVQLARTNGAATIVITNHATSPLARAADLVLASTAQGSPLIGENAAARIAQLNILDALFVAVAQRSPSATKASLQRTMAAVDTRRRMRGP